MLYRPDGNDAGVVTTTVELTTFDDAAAYLKDWLGMN